MDRLEEIKREYIKEHNCIMIELDIEMSNTIHPMAGVGAASIAAVKIMQNANEFSVKLEALKCELKKEMYE